jgi:hypothetical protein
MNIFLKTLNFKFYCEKFNSFCELLLYQIFFERTSFCVT